MKLTGWYPRWLVDVVGGTEESDDGKIDTTTIRQVVAPSLTTLPYSVPATHIVSSLLWSTSAKLQYELADSELIYVGILPLIMKVWQLSFFLTWTTQSN